MGTTGSLPPLETAQTVCCVRCLASCNEAGRSGAVTPVRSPWLVVFLTCCVLSNKWGRHADRYRRVDPSIGTWPQPRCAAAKPAAACGPGPSRRAGGIGAVFALAALTGCSIHPLVDDVSPIPTEAIVAAARCELRLGLVHQVEVWFADEEPPVMGFDPNTVGEPGMLKAMQKSFPNIDLVGDWEQYMDIAIAYEWNFDITETNHADATASGCLPSTRWAPSI